KDAGVRQIVYLSFVGAGDDAGCLLARDHGRTEQLIRDSGLQYTFLRDNFYAEAIAGFAGADGVVRGRADEGRVASAAPRSLSPVAAVLLRAPGEHLTAVYTLTGPEAITLDEIARILTAVTGKPYSYLGETMDQARASRAQYDAPEWLVD